MISTGTWKQEEKMTHVHHSLGGCGIQTSKWLLWTILFFMMAKHPSSHVPHVGPEKNNSPWVGVQWDSTVDIQTAGTSFMWNRCQAGAPLWCFEQTLVSCWSRAGWKHKAAQHTVLRAMASLHLDLLLDVFLSELFWTFIYYIEVKSKCFFK